MELSSKARWLTGNRCLSLRTALLVAFYTCDQLAELVRFRFHLHLHEIVREPENLRETVNTLLLWTEEGNQVEALIRFAAQERSEEATRPLYAQPSAAIPARAGST